MSLRNFKSKDTRKQEPLIRLNSLQDLKHIKEDPVLFENKPIKLYFDFGNIKFDDYEDVDHIAKFLRYKICADDCDNNNALNGMVTEAYELIKKEWKDPPELFISVIGGFKRMNITKRQRNLFKQGLIEIMKSNRTVIITGGFNVGITKLVSECVREFKNLYSKQANHVYLIGISTWGVVSNNSCLVTKRHNIQCQYPNNDGNSQEKGQVALDPTCDFFIFCDDNTSREYDKEIEFLSLLEKCAQYIEKSFMVQILFEGGHRAISRAYQTLKNEISIVVINHSGRASDLICEVMSINDDSNEKKLEIVDRYKKLINIPDTDIEKIKESLMDMYQKYQKQIFIFDMENYTSKFNNVILEAVITGQTKRNSKEILELSIQFNCVDIANKYLKTDYAMIADKVINDCFLNVLENNKHEFVNFFLDKDYQYENIITKESLEKLYNVWYDKSVDLSSVGKTISILSGEILNDIYGKKSSEKYGFHDLFLWALLCNRMELAKIFWINGKDHVSSALIGSIILNNKASRIIKRGDSEHQKQLIQESQNFQDLALNVLTKAFSVNTDRTILILTRQLKMWNKTSCFDIALNGQLLTFLNHSASTSYTTSVWMGDLSPLINTWKILLNIPFSLCFLQCMIAPSFQEKTSVDDQKIQRQYSCSLDASPEEGIRTRSITTETDCCGNYSFFEAIGKFYSAPVVKFYINFVSYILFLLAFAYLNLVELKPRNMITGAKDIPAEIYIYIYLLSFVLDELRQVYDQNNIGLAFKIKGYFSGSCNWWDVVNIAVFSISVIFRFMLLEEHFMICRCLFSICYCLFCLRTLQFYFVYEFIGPKVLMISKMIRDIVFFLSIFTLFIISFGTLSQSMRSPNSEMNMSLLNDIFKLPYFQIYGEVMLEKAVDEITCETINCVVQYTTIILGLAIYLLLTNILLVNLLIAMFGYTFNSIHSESRKHWSFIRLQLVKEFYMKPIFPPPFNVLWYIIRFVGYLIRKEQNRKDDSNPLLKKLNEKIDRNITEFEKMCVNEDLNHYDQNGTSSRHIEATDFASNISSQKDIELQGKLENIDATTAQILQTLKLISKEREEFQLQCERRISKLERDIDCWVPNRPLEPYIRKQNK